MRDIIKIVLSVIILSSPFMAFADDNKCGTSYCNNDHELNCEETYDETTGRYINCLPTSCTYGYLLLGNVCVKNTDLCTNLSGCTGNISGEATTAQIGGGIDYSGCKCEKEITVNNGRATETCAHKNGEDDGWKSGNECTTKITSCNAGYCVTNDNSNKCSQAPIGYYHDTQDTKSCTACPNASTTEKVGAAAKTDCVYVRGAGGTQFCDYNGCFTLPWSNDPSNQQPDSDKYIHYTN